MPGAGGALKDAEAGGSCRIVGRPQHAAGDAILIFGGTLEELDDLFFIPDVIAGGQHLDAQAQ